MSSGLMGFVSGTSMNRRIAKPRPYDSLRNFASSADRPRGSPASSGGLDSGRKPSCGDSFLPNSSSVRQPSCGNGFQPNSSSGGIDPSGQLSSGNGSLPNSSSGG